jgi:galactose mutarotase-like enzyme
MSEITRIKSDALRLEISARGAEIQALSTSDGTEWMWNGDAHWWTGRSPILFPIVGKAPDDKIVIEGKTFDMVQHGFARRSMFSLADETASTCRYELAASDATRSQFPFEFLLSVTYALDGTKLSVSAEVQNRDTRPMPFGFGFHPAFLWPLPGAAGRPHMITLDNGAEPPLVRLAQGLVDPHPLPSPFLSGQLVVDQALFRADAMIFPEGAGQGLTYGATDGPRLTFAFDNLPNLALWQKPGAPFICIEPWHGTAAELGGTDDLMDRPYTTTLQPTEKARFGLTVDVTR